MKRYSRALTWSGVLPVQHAPIDIILDEDDKRKQPVHQVRNREAEKLDEGLHDTNLDADDDVNVSHLEIFR